MVYNECKIIKEEALMQTEALEKMVLDIKTLKTETQTIELKAADYCRGNNIILINGWLE